MWELLKSHKTFAELGVVSVRYTQFSGVVKVAVVFKNNRVLLAWL